MKEDTRGKMIAGPGLITLSLAVLTVHYPIFRDTQHLFIFFTGDSDVYYRAAIRRSLFFLRSYRIRPELAVESATIAIISPAVRGDNMIGPWSISTSV